MPKIEKSRGSVEHLHVSVTADVALTAGMTVAIAIGRASDGTYTWLAAGWTGAEAVTRTAVTSTVVTFSTANYPLRTYKIYVKVTDTPEVPVIEAGELEIT